MRGSLKCVLVRILQGDTQWDVCLSIYLETYFKIYSEELAHLMVESSKSKICRVGQWAGDLRKS